MSELGLGTEQPGRRARRKQKRGCLPVIIALAIIAVLGYFVYDRGVDFLRDTLAGPEDYAGDGSGSVPIEIPSGSTATDIAAILYEADVVKSEQAFVDAANANPQSSSIQAGFYEMRKQMSAESALELMLTSDPAEAGVSVTIPEGRPYDEVLQIIVDETDFTKAQVQKAYDDTKALGLPAYAEGDPEGYLFPATYQVTPDKDAADLLAEMVETFKSRAEGLDLEGRAEKLGYSPHDIVTIASLIQGEAGSSDDMRTVASVVYNRLDIAMPLQFDSTNRYAVDTLGIEAPGGDITEVDSPYNSYDNQGLPPTPINSPGEEALEAALNPQDTDYLYFVTVNLETGETKFATNLDDHNVNVQELRDYCDTSDLC